jgi:hypothetical protein
MGAHSHVHGRQEWKKLDRLFARFESISISFCAENEHFCSVESCVYAWINQNRKFGNAPVLDRKFGFCHKAIAHVWYPGHD